MKLLIDSNVVIDVLQKREPHYLDSSKIWKMCETSVAEGYVSALTFANLVYIMRQELDADKIEETLKSLSLIFQFADLKAADLSKAAEMRWNDFEDALQEVIAKRLKADYIVTRNVKDFNGSDILAISPGEFLEKRYFDKKR